MFCFLLYFYLQIFWQFLTTLIGWVHGQEDSELHVHLDGVAVSEDERLALLLLAGQHHRDLFFIVVQCKALFIVGSR